MDAPASSLNITRQALRSHFRGLLIESGLHPSTAERLARAGRMSRGLIVILLGDSNSKHSAVLDVSAGLEMVHRASVIHDDVQDEDMIRRGAPSELSESGTAEALAIADVLLFLGISLMSETGLLPQLCRDLRGMALGQYLDIAGDVSELESSILTVAQKKTGLLVAFAFGAGAILGGRSEGDVLLLREIGMKVGTVFQLLNDLEDASAGTRRGRLTGGDRRLNRRTSLLLAENMLKERAGVSKNSIDAVARGFVNSQIDLLRSDANALIAELDRELPLVLSDLLIQFESGRSFIDDQGRIE